MSIGSMRRASTAITPPLRGSRASYVDQADILGVVVNEVAPGLHVLTHQHREDAVRGDRVLHGDLEKRPLVRVHRGLPELLGVHLAEALEPEDVHLLLSV